MNFSSNIFYPTILRPSVVPIAAINPRIIWRKASEERYAVEYMVAMEVMR